MGRIVKTAALAAILTAMLSNMRTSESDISNNVAYEAKLMKYLDAPTTGTVVIDPGHDKKFTGWDKSGGKIEANLNLDISRMLNYTLSNKGHTAILTRDSPTGLNVPLRDLSGEGKITRLDEAHARTRFLDSIDSDIIISIHYNANKQSRKVQGSEILIYGLLNKGQLKNGHPDRNKPGSCKIISEPSKIVAYKLQEYLSQKHGIDAKVIGTDVNLLRLNIHKTILIYEVGYLTNPDDFKKWTTQDGKQSVVKMLTDFVSENMDYIKSINKEYDLKRNLSYITRPLEERKNLSHLEKMMNETFWDRKTVDKNYLAIKENTSSNANSPKTKHPFQ